MSWMCKVISTGLSRNEGADVQRDITMRLRRPGNTVDDLFEVCSKDLKDFDAGICVTFMSCVSLLARDNSEEVQAALDRYRVHFQLYLDICIGHIPHIKISKLSQMVNAFARLDVPYEPFYEAVAEDLCSVVKRKDGMVRKWQLLSPRSMTSVSLALARAVHPEVELIESVKGHAWEHMDRYKG